QKSVDIVADLSAAAITVSPDPGDTTQIYDAILKSQEYLLRALLTPKNEMALTPTISLVGRNPANVPVPEIPDFEVRVFHVASQGWQALAAAFDVLPGCRGIIEDVAHFIGGSGYGVIHDEYVLQRVLLHKWAQGGFDRELALSNHVSVKV